MVTPIDTEVTRESLTPNRATDELPDGWSSRMNPQSGSSGDGRKGGREGHGEGMRRRNERNQRMIE